MQFNMTANPPIGGEVIQNEWGYAESFWSRYQRHDVHVPYILPYSHFKKIGKNFASWKKKFRAPRRLPWKFFFEKYHNFHASSDIERAGLRIAFWSHDQSHDVHVPYILPYSRFKKIGKIFVFWKKSFETRGGFLGIFFFEKYHNFHASSGIERVDLRRVIWSPDQTSSYACTINFTILTFRKKWQKFCILKKKNLRPEEAPWIFFFVTDVIIFMPLQT